VDDYTENSKYRLELAYKRARIMIEDNKVKNKELYDRTKNRRPSLTKNPFTLRITGIKIGNLDRWKLIQKIQQFLG